MPVDVDISLYETISLIICFFASGFFSGSEAILMSVGVDRAKQLIEEGGARANAMKFMIEKPNEILTTILVGNNIANILAASLTTVITARVFKSDSVGIATGITTIVILIFGEIIPKTFARTNAEKFSTPVIQILRFFYICLFPIISFMVWIIEKILGDNAELSDRLVKKTDIEYMVNRAEKDQSIDSKQIDLLNSILEFPTIKVKDIMVPRTKVKFIKTELSFFEMIDLIKEDAHSRYPVCEGELEDTLGFVHIKDFAFIRGEEKQNFDLKKILKEPFFVYEHMKIQAVFDHMNEKKLHIALVKDENGVVVGVITLEDIIEEIFGEILDEHDEDESEEFDENSVETKEGLIVPGSMSIRDLSHEYEIEIALNDNYSTLNGFILDKLGDSFPQENQLIIWEGFSFELTKVENHEIKEITIKLVDKSKMLKRNSDHVEEEDLPQIENLSADF